MHDQASLDSRTQTEKLRRHVTVRVTRRHALGSLFAAGLGVGATVREGAARSQNTRFTRLPVWREPRVKGFKDLSGNKVYYEESGLGMPVVLTAASNYDAETTRGLAEQLANKYR